MASAPVLVELIGRLVIVVFCTPAIVPVFLPRRVFAAGCVRVPINVFEGFIVDSIIRHRSLLFLIKYMLRGM